LRVWPTSRPNPVFRRRFDLIVYYLTYVFVPALALLQACYLGAGFGVVLASLILLSSLFHFSDTESKSEDHCFVGFPAIWNIVAFYVFAFRMPIWAASLLVLACVALTFVPLRWAHPLRTPLLWPVTLALMGVWMLAAFLTLWSGFPAGPSAQAALLLVAVYGVGLVLLCSRSGSKPA
jgi:phosphatidylcholine synthase